MKASWVGGESRLLRPAAAGGIKQRDWRAGTQPDRRSSHARSLTYPASSHGPSLSLAWPLLGFCLPTLSTDHTAQGCARPNQRNSFHSPRERGKHVVPSPCTMDNLSAGQNRRHEEGRSSSGRVRRGGHLCPGMQLSPFLLVFPAPLAHTPGEVGYKVSERGVDSCKWCSGWVQTLEARTEELLAMSLFCSRGQTWPGVAGRVRGPPTATFWTL